MKYKFHLSNFFIGFLLHQYLPQTTNASIRNKCPSGGPISALSDKSHSLEFPPARDLQLWINYIFTYNKWGRKIKCHNVLGMRIQVKFRCLANILGFVLQNLTQYIHHTSCTFKNHSQLNMYRHCKSLSED